MLKLCSSVAILLFTRSARAEAAHKQFGSTHYDTAVAAQLIHHATVTAQQVGVDFLCVDSSQQVGHSFGQRLANALQQAFTQGYERLVVIGNDCPQLNASVLRQAVAALTDSDAVLGPATDGGVYLVGVARTQFDAAAWAVLPWQTPALGTALAQQLRAAGAIVTRLALLSDVDNAQDLARVLRQPLVHRLQRVLRRLRATTYRLRPTIVRPVLSPCVATQPHRGPPIS